MVTLCFFAVAFFLQASALPSPSGIPGHGFQAADAEIHGVPGPDHPARGGPHLAGILI